MPNSAFATEAQRYASKALKQLAWLSVNAKSETSRVAAISALLARAYGQPMQHAEVAVKTDSRELNRAELLAIIAASRSPVTVNVTDAEAVTVIADRVELSPGIFVTQEQLAAGPRPGVLPEEDEPELDPPDGTVH